MSNKASKRSRTNTPTPDDSNCGGDLAGMLKPMDDDDTEDQVQNLLKHIFLELVAPLVVELRKQVLVFW